MGSKPEISLIVCTYQKPYHLERVLESVALQQNVDGLMEVVVTDDGSTDNTAEVVEQFASRVSFPVHFTTHEHKAFQLSRSRNEGFAIATAPYVVFLDGDCILPPDHVTHHLQQRRPRTITGGYCCRLDEATSDKITVEAIRTGEYLNWIPKSELRKLRTLAWKSSFYNWINHPTKPRLYGGNIAVWRDDFERINGFDENFVGWGGEDDDMRLRARQAGIGIRSILHKSRSYHLWHPPDSSAPANITEGRNIPYLLRQGRLSRCVNGLHKRSVEDLAIKVYSPNPEVDSTTPLQPLNDLPQHAGQGTEPELEVVCVPGTGNFSGTADINMLVVLDEQPVSSKLTNQAHVVVSAQNNSIPMSERIYRLDQLQKALKEAA